LGNQKGFTLIEIIAVLVILGILAAIAVPKYIDVQSSARVRAAQGAVAEVKGRASALYGKKLMEGAGVQPTVASIVASLSTDAGTDFALTATAQGTTGILITVGTFQGVAITAVTGIWPMPTT
jgi:prepilin-type N-terminal cleavage/methylation domain-containing protein